jgi:hypothetical protein
MVAASHDQRNVALEGLLPRGWTQRLDPVVSPVAIQSVQGRRLHQE